MILRPRDTVPARLLVPALCIALRLALFLIFRPWDGDVESRRLLRDDAAGYHRIAITLLTDHRFAFGPAEPPNATRTPVYPAFVAGVYSVAGERPWAVLLLQIVLDTLSCFLLLSAVRRICGRTAAVAAAVLYAIDPFLIVYASTTLLSDTLFVFFLVLSFWLLCRGRLADRTQASAVPWFAACACVLGVAALTRPIAQYLPICLVAFFLIAYRGRPRRALTISVMSLAVFALVLLPWLARNRNVMGTFALSSSDAYNLLVLDVAPMESGRRHVALAVATDSLTVAADALARADGADPARMNDLEMAPYWRRVAVDCIRRDPAGFGRTYLLGVFHTMFNLGTGIFADRLGFGTGNFDIWAHRNVAEMIRAFLREKSIPSLVLGGMIALFLLVSYAATVAGLAVGWKRAPDRALLGLCLVVALYFVLITGTAGIARFKMPAIPFYLPFAGIGWEAVIGGTLLPARRRERSSKAAKTCNRPASSPS